MNKSEFISKLQEETGRTENECIIINHVLESHFIVGRNNKEKMIADFMEKLNIEYEEADKLYNTCSSLIVKGVFRKD